MIHIGLVCKKCNSHQAIGFEKYNETWGDLIAHCKLVGYIFEGGPRQEDIKIIKCPQCPKEKE